MQGICKFCKSEFRKREKTRKFCSSICSNKYNLNGINKVILPSKNESLAEFIGICLGDGYASGYQAGVTLNSIADQEYIPYVENLARKLFPGATFSITKRRNENAIDIKINSILVVEFLKSMGIRSNAKVVPDWVLKKSDFIRMCVRGLFDTEGSISFKLYKSRKGIIVYKQLNFRNANMKLMKFVKDALLDLGLKPTTTMKRSLYLSNHESIDRYRDYIGFSNSKLLERSLVYNIDEYLRVQKQKIVVLSRNTGI